VQITIWLETPKNGENGDVVIYHSMLSHSPHPLFPTLEATSMYHTSKSTKTCKVLDPRSPAGTNTLNFLVLHASREYNISSNNFG